MNPASLALADGVALRRPAEALAPAELRPRPVAILGVPFDAVSSEDTLDRIDAMIASRRSHYVVTANVDFLVQARRDVELRRILIDADLVLCDGTPLLWVSRWLGNALPERVAGSDLAPRLLARAAERGHRVYFLGAGPGVAADAAARLQRMYPTLQIVGHFSPPLASLLDLDHDAIRREIQAAAPDLLLVSFGCPKQEKWIAMHYRTLGVPVCIGVGATLDFLAGRVKRAPDWMRRGGCEWLYRLWQEPRRLYRRYAADLYSFVPALTVQWWRLARGGIETTASVRSIEGSTDYRRFEVTTELTRLALEKNAAIWQSIVSSPVPVLLELTEVRRIDAAGLAFLVCCRQTLQRRGQSLILIGVQRAVRDALASSRILEFFELATDLSKAPPMASSLGASVVVRDAEDNLSWRGEITAAEVDAVWTATRQMVSAAVGPTVVRIDLAPLRFIDSSAAAMMRRLQQWAHTAGMKIVFAGARPSVRDVLRRTGVDRAISIETS